jgi:ribosome-associated toxin RatA of RatAB toxin-antitoxin module
MRTVDSIHIAAPPAEVFSLAATVERWPEILPHYRSVRFLERRTGGGLVEMAARRPFGPVSYPAWWVSEMTVDQRRGEIRYRHVRGITAGMDVLWRVAAGNGEGGRDGGSDVSVVHEWAGPSWPLIGGLAARLVIGPVFVHGIASRTLAGLKEALEKA